ncbi:DUF4416 family protein [bacterium]|nr:DUF4416 family protein [bacterium]
MTRPPYGIVIGILSQVNLDWTPIRDEITAIFGKIETESQVIPFTSDYYAGEMGGPLHKQWLGIIPHEYKTQLSIYKYESGAIENRYKVDGNRQFNIDPGILFPHNLLLLSTKNYAHRIPISAQIFAEVELIRKKSRWEPLQWTYPDYKTSEFIQFANDFRNVVIKLFD